MEKKLSVMVVDDSMTYRSILSQILNGFSGVQVVDTASNGKLAIERIKRSNPDLITLDIQMPVMDGLETLRELHKNYPEVDVVMLSSCNVKSADQTVLALLEVGTTEFIVKPRALNPGQASKELSSQLLKVINLVRAKKEKLKSDKVIEPLSAPVSPIIKPSPARSPELIKNMKLRRPTIVDVVLIGSSTGGPKALETLITRLPAKLKVPILIVQHMPELFTKSLANLLNRKSAISVCEGSNGEDIMPGCVYIAPGGRHMTVARNRDKGGRFIKLDNEPPENSCRPSVDHLFRSAVKAYRAERVLCVIMTGMGSDGYKGVQSLQGNDGGYCLTQSKESCVVYGMPKAIVDGGLTHEAVELDMLADKIIGIVGL